MSTIASPRSKPAIVYPESDDLPMADNTKQFRWIVTIQGGIDAIFRDNPDVFVAGNLLWYPVEGNNAIRVAPDIMAVLGRPKRDRGSYMQWLEDNIAPQVTFEVLSPGNRFGEILDKFKFYENHGVEEYYLWDPEKADLTGWTRNNGQFKAIPQMTGWISPRLKVRFAVADNDLHLYGPDGKRFSTYVEVVAEREQAMQRAERLAAQLKALGVEPEV